MNDVISLRIHSIVVRIRQLFLGTEQFLPTKSQRTVELLLSLLLKLSPFSFISLVTFRPPKIRVIPNHLDRAWQMLPFLSTVCALLSILKKYFSPLNDKR